MKTILGMSIQACGTAGWEEFEMARGSHDASAGLTAHAMPQLVPNALSSTEGQEQT